MAVVRFAWRPRVHAVQPHSRLHAQMQSLRVEQKHEGRTKASRSATVDSSVGTLHQPSDKRFLFVGKKLSTADEARQAREGCCGRGAR